MAKKKKFYVTERDYIGFDNLRHYDLDSKIYCVETEPPRTNLSHEIKKYGWLGSNNSYSYYAHGEYPTKERAIEKIRELGGVRELEDKPDCYTVYDCDTVWRGNWIVDGNEFSNDQLFNTDLKKLAQKIVKDAKEEQDVCVFEDDILDELKEIRNERLESLIEEIDDIVDVDAYYAEHYVENGDVDKEAVREKARAVSDVLWKDERIRVKPDEIEKYL